MSLVESQKHPAEAVFRHTIPAGEHYLFEVKKGQTLRLHDLEGNQAIDTLFYNADNPRERYDPQRTLRRQNNAYLTTGSVLWSGLGNPLLTIVADTCGRHDTLGGACAQESNTVRYSLDKRYMHSCRDNFLCACLHDGRLHKRDIGANINFFMNVPVTPGGWADL
ncbi:urea carboxylase-associated protein 1 [Pseudescherichia vulneris]|nr:urea carboxylase-associated protein 1 [Pseudescherichia vulneris]